MEDLEIGFGEAALFDQRDRQCIADHRLQRGRRGGSELVGAGLLHLGERQADVGGAAGGAVAVRGDDDELHPEATAIGDDVAQLGRLAGPGQRDDDVFGRDHAEIAMTGLAWMDEHGRRAGGGQRGGDLAADQPALPHTGDDRATLGRVDRVDGLYERMPQVGLPQRERQRSERLLLDPHRLDRREHGELANLAHLHDTRTPLVPVTLRRGSPRSPANCIFRMHVDFHCFRIAVQQNEG